MTDRNGRELNVGDAVQVVTVTGKTLGFGTLYGVVGKVSCIRSDGKIEVDHGPNRGGQVWITVTAPALVELLES